MDFFFNAMTKIAIIITKRIIAIPAVGNPI